MSVPISAGATLVMPWLPPGHTMVLPGRGEVFYRYHRHANPAAPTLLLLHGWTASADLQFFTAYEALAEHYSFVAIDHRGHGRGLRSPAKFDLVEVADDAALLVQSLGLAEVVTVGYSMGGPISLLLTQRHPQLVRALVVQATALEWRAKWYERLEWKTVHVMGPVLRSSMFPRWMRWGIRRLLGPNHPLEQYVPWLACELSRNDTFSLVHAGQSLSRYDARVFASALGKPAASMVTTRDRLVKPRKQRALADALNAFVVEVPDDHLASWTSPDAFAKATVQLVQHVVG
ncbi:MAG: alpha/beta hydrolase [Actinobacteria bacterium]|nr:alpha/beta hydrolase [Acidimicrobiaceae bacterium]MBP6488192.1 alpha/beta hydrolase [Ilumatobacteraceae bacterium]NMD25398.1 alpha/beta hydrolase [Actinomycetota bacterium]MBP7889356.1 alpha/beta hydrolase [Ilumatobacteraceae bacterium]MBP8211891.1 alpha/beta hydrolase [Ilumatobacteraceae bacterium]